MGRERVRQRLLRGHTGVRPARASTTAYEAGAQTRRTVGWQVPETTANSALQWNLTTIRNRARNAARNDGHARSVIDTLVTNIVGTGIKPLSQIGDDAVRQEVQALWERWTDESDADGLLDFYGQQTQAVRTWKDAGECFVRLRPRRTEDRLSVPLQIQLLEPEQCPLHYSGTAPNGNSVRMGIEFDAIGRRRAYWFHPSRAGATEDFDRGQLRRVPAESVVHLYDPERPGQLRGLPGLTPALVDLVELNKTKDAVVLRTQLQNLFAGFVTRPASSPDDADIDPLTGRRLGGDDDRPMVQLEPGTFQELGPGETLEWSKPPDMQTGYVDFMRQQLYAVAAATGVPYEEITGDMKNVNDRTVRVILQAFRRRVMRMQHQIVGFQLCRAVWWAWLDRAWLAGALPLPIDYIENPAPWRAVRWMPQGWPYINPVQDLEAAKGSVRAGFKSRSAVVSEQGDDAEVIDQEQAKDNARADALSLRYDSDGRFASDGSGGADEAEDDQADTGGKDRGADGQFRRRRRQEQETGATA